MRSVVAKGKGKIIFVVFLVPVLLILVGIGAVAGTALAAENSTFTVPAQSVFYDEKDAYVSTDEEGEIKKNWDSTWKVRLGEQGDYSCGEHALIFQPSSAAASLYGGGYRIYYDGGVEKLGTSTNIAANQPAFYKVDDRYYLMVGPTITSEEPSVSASLYLGVRIDKAGNAWLFNDKINTRTTNPVTLTCDRMTFDVAKETLTIAATDGGEDQVIDLSRIQGTTNEYKESNALSNVATAITSGSSSSGSSSSGSSSSGSAASGGSSSGTTTKVTPSLSLTGTSSTTNSITVYYLCNDPQGRFATTYMTYAEIVAGVMGESQQVLLNSGSANKTIYGLSPNSEYQITLGYTLYSDKTGEYHNTDFVRVSTSSADIGINVIGLSASTITANVVYDKSLPLDSANLVLYLNGQEKEKQAINSEDALSALGWTGYFTNASRSSADTYKLVLEDAVYQGESVEVTAQCTFRNNAY